MKRKPKLISEEGWEGGKERLSTTFILSSFILLILVIAIILASGVVILIQYLRGTEIVFDLWFAILLVFIISVVMGYGLSLLLGKTVLAKPINVLVSAMQRLADGDFSARLSEPTGITKNVPIVKDIITNFNRMAEELGNTEMLRSDFVNNFSHEFKTPIVSIAGFADLLRSENLTDEERDNYLSIISAESRRLASLATNILNLTRIENQSILTDVTTFNLSEQIRSTVLVLESKWAVRGIVPILDFDEVDIGANEQLLKEVWMNLLDNAIKFSPDCGEIEVKIEELGGRIAVSITNSGKEIPEEAAEKIFSKFYQADESHSGEGSGVGLAVVKKVVDLHRGTVGVESRDGKNIFTVVLPKTARHGAQKS